MRTRTALPPVDGASDLDRVKPSVAETRCAGRWLSLPTILSSIAFTMPITVAGADDVSNAVDGERGGAPYDHTILAGARD
jgi:hypothetical protein